MRTFLVCDTNRSRRWVAEPFLLNRWYQLLDSTTAHPIPSRVRSPCAEGWAAAVLSLRSVRNSRRRMLFQGGSALQDVLTRHRGADAVQIQKRGHTAEHHDHVPHQPEWVLTGAVEEEVISDMPGRRPGLLHNALIVRRIRRNRLDDQVADIACSRLHCLGDRRLPSMPAPNPFLTGKPLGPFH